MTDLQADFVEACETYNQQLKAREAEQDAERQLFKAQRRLSLASICTFFVSAALLLGFLYYSTAGIMERQTAETIQAEITGLAEQYRAQGLSRLREVVERRSDANPQRASIYLLTDPAGRRMAGNLDRWPEVAAGADGWLTFTVEAQVDGESAERRRARAATFSLTGGYRLLVGRDVEDRLQIQALILPAVLGGIGITALVTLLLWFGGKRMVTFQRQVERQGAGRSEHRAEGS